MKEFDCGIIEKGFKEYVAVCYGTEVTEVLYEHLRRAWFSSMYYYFSMENSIEEHSKVKKFLHLSCQAELDKFEAEITSKSAKAGSNVH